MICDCRVKGPKHDSLLWSRVCWSISLTRIYPTCSPALASSIACARICSGVEGDAKR